MPSAASKFRIERAQGPAAEASLNVREFLGHVLPQGGSFCLFHKASGYPEHEWFATQDELCAGIERHADTVDLYFATAAYSEPTERTQANVRALKSLRLDIDAGAKKFAKDPEGTYPTQRDAVVALNAAFKAGLPKASIVLSSGEGVHAYWALAEDADPESWVKAAVVLQKVCEHLGLKVDNKVTRDSARVLRPVGAMHNNGTRVGATLCKLTNPEPWNLEALRMSLIELLPEEDQFAVAAEASKLKRNVNDDILTVQGPPASIVKVAEHCQAIAWVRDTRGDVPEPVWRSFMGVAKYCEDGQDYIHPWSEGDSRYDYDATQAKFDRWETPPATCDSFRAYGKCKDCKYSGKITTPKQLGTLTPAEVLKAGGDPSALPPPSRAALQLDLPDWRIGIDGSKIGRPLNTVPNVVALARRAGIEIRLNLMTRKTEVIVPGLTAASDNCENTALIAFGDEAVRHGLNREGLPQLVDAAGSMNPHHPVVEAIKAHSWDGRDRLPEFHRSLALRDPSTAALAYELLDTFMLAGVAAWHSEAGFAAQGMLVLAGPQGIGKTRWAQALVPVEGAVRLGLNLDPASKDSVLRATSCALAELGELDATFRRADIASLKAFLTADRDVVRLPYAARESSFARRTVYVGTVNGTHFLHDDTGSRRFWVVEVAACEPMPAAEMLQVLAQYRRKLSDGARPYLPAATQARLSAANEAFEAVDPLRERVLGAFDWAMVQRAGWLDLPGVTWATATDICRHHLGIYEPTTAQATKVGGIVGKLNGGQRGRSNGQRTLALPPRKVA